MSNLTAVNRELHANFKIVETNDFSRFKNENLIPVVMQDFSALATEFPIVFVKNTDSDKMIPVAIMGIQTGVNIYCQDDTWDCHVKPLGFRNAPLTFMKTEDGSGDYIICFDDESPLVSETEGEAIFNEEGEQSDYFKERCQHLLDMIKFTEQTQAITQYFDDKNLLTGQKISVNLGNDQAPFNIDGIYIINENALNELDTDAFEEIRKKGFLELIYAHLTSLKQFQRLTLKQKAFDLAQSN